MASTYLTRTPGSAGNLTTWTFSGWFKRSSMGNTTILGCAIDGQNQDLIYFQSDGTLRWWRYGSNDYVGQLKTTRVFRDPSAWYHIVFVWDSSNATADNRMRIYVNGTQETVFTTRLNPPLNTTSLINTADALAIGRAEADIGTYPYFDGVMAHVHFTDGTAYDVSAFGETDSTTGQWKPKVSPSVTYGTNGFFLKFANSGSMGTDSSGNGNNFTVAAGTLTQTQDTPSNVFATINPNWSNYNANPSFSNLNLTISPTTTAYQNHFSTLGVQGSGKWYVEMKCNGSPNSAMYYGISNEAELDYLHTNSNVGGDTSYNYMIAMSSGDIRTNNSNSSYGSGFSDGDIMMFALDLDNSKVYFGKNGTWFNSGDPAAGTNPAASDVLTNTFYFFGGTAYTNGFTSVDYNFGNGYFGTTAVSSANSDGAGLGLFEYAPPTGFYSLCTKNINTYG